MSADQQGGALKPVTPARVADELRKLSAQRKDGTLQADEYEHRFSRMISELRDRRIDGSRAPGVSGIQVMGNVTSRHSSAMSVRIAPIASLPSG